MDQINDTDQAYILMEYQHGKTFGEIIEKYSITSQDQRMS
jgi:hypothetical protein